MFSTYLIYNEKYYINMFSVKIVWIYFTLTLTPLSLLLDVQEHVLSGGHGLMVQGYDPVIKALAKDIDICLNQRYACIFFSSF